MSRSSGFFIRFRYTLHPPGLEAERGPLSLEGPSWAARDPENLRVWGCQAPSVRVTGSSPVVSSTQSFPCVPETRAPGLLLGPDASATRRPPFSRVQLALRPPILTGEGRESRGPGARALRSAGEDDPVLRLPARPALPGTAAAAGSELGVSEAETFRVRKGPFLTGENPPASLERRSPRRAILNSPAGASRLGFQSAQGRRLPRPGALPYRVAAVELGAFGQAGLGLGSALHLLHDALDVASGDPVEEHGWGAERTRVVFCSAPHYFHIHTPGALSSSE